jgi:hypothetical protein
VGGTLVVSQNPLLEDVAALEGVDSMQLGVVVTGNDRLSSLQGIDRLRATNSVTIANNTALVEFGGLSDLEECGSFLAAGNGLTALALPSLARAGSLSITGHAALLAIDLPVLTSVETSLTFARRTSFRLQRELRRQRRDGDLQLRGARPRALART